MSDAIYRSPIPLPGPHDERPKASRLNSGTFYPCTTHGVVYYSTGEEWITFGSYGTAGALNNPLLAEGDLLIAGPGGAPMRLQRGGEGEVLTVENNQLAWRQIAMSAAHDHDTEYSPLVHVHDTAHDHEGVYSPTAHNHDTAYSATAHNHTGTYSPTAHTHAGVYSPTTHNHDTAYSPTSHTHDTTHNHDSTYSLTSHAHAGVYSPTSHNHDTAYSAAAHNHDSAYSAATHNHNASYATIAHNHDAAYAPAPAYARVTGSNATTTGQALVIVTGLSLPLLANSVYDFEAVLSVSTTNVTTGTRYGVNFSAAGATVEAQLIGSLTNAAGKSERINALNTASGTYLTTVSQTGQVLIRGIIATGANAGNLTIQHLKVTSGTSTVFINSFLKATKVA